MARVAGHLSVEELQAGYRGSDDAVLARHYQAIWLLAQGRSATEVARVTSFARRWVEQLLERYNAFGPGSLGDRRRKNGAAPTVLTPNFPLFDFATGRDALVTLVTGGNPALAPARQRSTRWSARSSRISKPRAPSTASPSAATPPPPSTCCAGSAPR